MYERLSVVDSRSCSWNGLARRSVSLFQWTKHDRQRKNMSTASVIATLKYHVWELELREGRRLYCRILLDSTEARLLPLQDDQLYADRRPLCGFEVEAVERCRSKPA
jgi:hypothetical protein